MKKLPFDYDLERKSILKSLGCAKEKLAELKGMVEALPNPYLPLKAIILSEAKASSEIENIVTTYDTIYKELIIHDYNPNSKEVINYRKAIMYGLDYIKSHHEITTKLIEDIHHIIEPNKGGYRSIPGTKIVNGNTGETVYTPPQDKQEISDLMNNLIDYINLEDEIDPLIKMCVIHYQFESIHPFYDGNGRTGRILNIIYLILKDVIDLPILYLSKYINDNKDEYYVLFRAVRENDYYFDGFITYLLDGIRQTSQLNINFILSFQNAISSIYATLNEEAKELAKPEIVNCLFYDFYVSNESFRNRVNLSRNTASKYLSKLCELKILEKEKVGRHYIYKNNYLLTLITLMN